MHFSLGRRLVTISSTPELTVDSNGTKLISTGLIDTEIHASGGEPDRAQRLASQIPMGRPGTAEEVARAIMWLISPESSYSTGTVVTVSGGRVI